MNSQHLFKPKCIIVDDDEFVRKQLISFAKVSGQIDILSDFENPLEALQFIKKNNVDFIFLDIGMPEINGLDFLKSFNSPPQTIIITLNVEHAVEMYQYDYIIDFLAKPISLQRFLLSEEKAKKRIQETKKQNNTDFIFINYKNVLRKIMFDEILYVESESDYVSIVTVEKKYLVHSTMKHIKEKLWSDVFFQVHRSYIVNIKKINEVEDNSIIIGKNIIPISRNNKQLFLEKLNLI